MREAGAAKSPGPPFSHIHWGAWKGCSAKFACRTPHNPGPYGSESPLLPHPRSLGFYGLYLILSYAAAETLPARSLYLTYTVLVPAPEVNLHDLLVA